MKTSVKSMFLALSMVIIAVPAAPVDSASPVDDRLTDGSTTSGSPASAESSPPVTCPGGMPTKYVHLCNAGCQSCLATAVHCFAEVLDEFENEFPTFDRATDIIYVEAEQLKIKNDQYLPMIDNDATLLFLKPSERLTRCSREEVFTQNEVDAATFNQVVESLRIILSKIFNGTDFNRMGLVQS